MGYYTDRHLPVDDMLARAYCVCDAWHSPTPGDTWPNRLYSIAGCEGDPVAHKLAWLADLFGKGLRGKLDNIPLYELEAFTRHLDGDQWRWYSHDPASLRAVDERYRDLTNLDRSNFAY